MAALDQLETKYFPAIPTVVPHSGNTEVLPHVDGEEYFAAIYSAIEATEGPDDRIYIASWLFERQTRLILGPKRLDQLLVAKADLKVDVRIIVWTGRLVLHTQDLDPDFSETEWWISRTAEALDLFGDVVGANIANVRGLRTVTTLPEIAPPLAGRVLMDWSGDFGSRHQKYTVVYRRSTGDLRAFVGGMDFAEKNVNPFLHPTNNSPHDVGVECRGEAGRSVWNDFKTRWEEVRSLPGARFRFGPIVEHFNPTTDASLHVPPVPSPGTAIVTPVVSSSGVRIVRSYDRIKDSMLWGDDLPWETLPPEGLQEILAVFRKALNVATRYVYIEDQGLNSFEGFTSHILLWPLVAAAITKGVKVIGVTSGEDDDNRVLVPSIWTVFLDHVSPVVRPNFVMYRVDRMEVHSKVVLIDDEFLSIGSANFWDRSMRFQDTELTAVAVDTGSLVKDLRVRLWADHLRVDPSDASVRAELEDLDKSLAIFRAAWGTGVSFPTPNSKLQLIGPVA